MQHVSRILVVLAAVVLAGCSSFDRRFAAASRVRAKDDPCAGAYAGKWSSSQHPGGGGELRCIVTAASSTERRGGRDYRADFHARWHGFSSEHSIVLHTKPSRKGRGVRDFSGTSEIRMFIGSGTYRCEGAMDGDQMRACYDATYDKGTFDLMRARTE